MSTSSAILRLAAWSYLPDFLTQKLLSTLYTLPISILPRCPPPNSPLRVKHYRLTFALLVLLFLAYTLLAAFQSEPPNFYEVLSVHPGANEGALKAAFRAYAKKAHPDHAGEAAGEAFGRVREGYEALRNPVLRWAYDRFGPDALTWSHCGTRREYLWYGLQQASGYHIVTGAGLLFFSAIGRPSPVAFWRYLLFFTLFATELLLLLSPSPHADPAETSLVLRLLPTRVAHQHVRFLHHFFVSGSVALSRVAPALGPIIREWVGLPIEEGNEQGQMAAMGSLVERFAGLVRAADREVFQMLHTDLHSIQSPSSPSPSSSTHSPNVGVDLRPLSDPDPRVLASLETEMQHMIVEGKLRHEAPLRSAWEAAVRRGRGQKRFLSSPLIFSPANGNGKMGLRSLPEDEAVTGEFALTNGKVNGEDELESVGGAGRLPSPRPSPPPPPGLLRRGTGMSYSESGLRARSVSC